MAYLVRPDGAILAETLPEAFALSDAMTARHAARLPVNPIPPAAPSASPQPTVSVGPSLWPEFLAHVDRSGTGVMRHLLAVIQAAGAGRIAKADIDAALGLHPAKLSGVLSGLAKNAKKVGLRSDDVFVSVHRGYGKGRTLHYRAGKVLLAAPPVDLPPPHRA